MYTRCIYTDTLYGFSVQNLVITSRVELGDNVITGTEYVVSL